MKGTVNPFEPWRPPVERLPRPLHVGRPWRPPPPPPVRAAVEEPPFVEPVKPTPRKKPPERPKQPQARTGPSLLKRTLISLMAVWAVFALLGLLSFDFMVVLSSSHAPRLIALGVSAALFAFLMLNHRHGWSTRLTWMVAVLAWAGIALWFAPTTHGVNLWSAYRQIEKLRALPPGDVAGYQRDAATRRTVIEEFPSFAADVKTAEQAWLRRTVDRAIENADRQLDKDPDAVLTRLRRLETELPELKQHDSMKKDLESALHRAVQAFLKVAQP